MLQLHPQAIFGVEFAGGVNQLESKVLIDAPVARFVGIRQRTSSHAAANAQMVKLGGMCAQSDFNVSQAFAKGQLSESHAGNLVAQTDGVYY